MTQSAQQVIQAGMALSEAERAEVASALWESIEDERDLVLSPEWRAEIRRRIEESDRGEGISLTEEEVEQRLRDRYGPLPD
jgi:putative addiction module component (TIGR02574 family)